MAFTTFRRTIATSAGVLYAHPKADDVAGDYTARKVVLINVSTTQTVVYLGPLGVTTADGARWTVEAGRTLEVEVEPGESLYGIVASGSQDIDVLANGR